LDPTLFAPAAIES